MASSFILLGLTGGIGSGKSSAASFLRRHNIPVIDCDVLGHKTYEPGTDTFRQVVATFGEGIVADNGTIDRRLLGSFVFGQPERLKQLTDIVWPGIRKLLMEEISRLKQQQEEEEKKGVQKIIAVEAAVLFEAGWDDVCDEVWCVIASEENVISRLKQRNNMDAQAAKARIASQMSNEERKAKCGNNCIENNGTLEQFEHQIKAKLDALLMGGTAKLNKL